MKIKCNNCTNLIKRQSTTGYCKKCLHSLHICVGSSHLPEVRAKISKSLKGKSTGKARTEEAEIERRKKISISMKQNPNAGGLRMGSGRGKKQWYVSEHAGRVYIRSTYELEYVNWLDKNKINWKQNLIKFPYQWEGRIRYYYPDFYLPDTNEYIEIKGYKTDKDLAKWKDFPYKLTVLMYNDLIKLGLNIK